MPSLLYMLRRRRTWLSFGALTALAGLLAMLPLLGVLGFEFSLIFSLAGSVAAAHLGVRTVVLTREADESLVLGTRSGPRVLLSLLGRGIALGWLSLLLPLLVIGLNALRVRNCDPLGGLGFFLAMPVVSVAIAASVGVLWGLTLRRSLAATLAALATIVLCLGWGVYRFYAEPAIFGYDPFAGYFPGTLYDEDVALRLPFLFARLQQLCWLGTAIVIGAVTLDPAALRLRLPLGPPPPRRAERRRSGRRHLLVVGLLLLGGAVTLTALRARLGFAVDADEIRRQLGGLRKTQHFEILYPETLSRQQVDRLAEDHEFRYAQLHALFGGPTRRIRSYIFADAEQKRRLMGAARVFVAKPWRSEVYLQDEGFPHRVLGHELAHVFAARHGDALFGISLAWRRSALGLPLPHFNVGLIEGLAVAVDWRGGGALDGHQRAAALLRLGLAPRLESLFGLGFLAHASARSYGLAGSFCRYLLEQHGFDKLALLYRSAGDFQRVYGRSVGSLLSSWRSFLRRVELSPAQLALAEARYRRPSIFRRVCAHAIANLSNTARQLEQREKREEALHVIERICRFDPGDPAHRIAELRARAAARGPRAGLEQVQKLLAHPSLSKPQRRRVLELAGDLHYLAKQRAEAATAYRQAAQLPAERGARRVSTLKLLALKLPEPLRRVLFDYLIVAPGKRRKVARDVHRTHQLAGLLAALGPRDPLRRWAGLGDYLLGKQLSAHDEFRLALVPLRRALAQGLDDEDLRVEALRTLASCEYRAGDLEAAAKSWHDLRARLPRGGLRRSVEDWIERTYWRRRGTLPPRSRRLPTSLPTSLPAGRLLGPASAPANAGQAQSSSGPAARTGSRLSGASRP